MGIPTIRPHLLQSLICCLTRRPLRKVASCDRSLIRGGPLYIVSFLLLVHKSSMVNFIVFFPTPMLNQDFTPAVESPLIIIKILNSIFHKFVVAVFITFVTFVVFAGRCVLLSPKLATATALVSSRLYRNIALKDILTLHLVQNYLLRVVTRSPRFSHSVPLLKSLHMLPDMYTYLSSTFIQVTSIFTFTAHSCKTANTASIV